MITEYDKKYDEQIKDLLVELQNYLIDIDDWHTQVMLPEYREKTFKMDMEVVKKQNGKVFVSVEDGIVNGVIMGVVNNPDEVDRLTNDCAKIGMVLELIVSKADRGKGTGKKLLNKIEEYFNDDKIYLAMKWGRLYRPDEWIELERNYNEMMNSFDIQD